MKRHGQAAIFESGRDLKHVTSRNKTWAVLRLSESHLSADILQLFLCLHKHHDAKAYGGVEVKLHSLISAPDGGEWSVSRHSTPTLFPGERRRGTHCITGWLGTGANLYILGKRKLYFPCRELNEYFPTRKQLSYRLRYRGS